MGFDGLIEGIGAVDAAPAGDADVEFYVTLVTERPTRCRSQSVFWS